MHHKADGTRPFGLAVPGALRIWVGVVVVLLLLLLLLRRLRCSSVAQARRLLARHQAHQHSGIRGRGAAGGVLAAAARSGCAVQGGLQGQTARQLAHAAAGMGRMCIAVPVPLPHGAAQQAPK